MKKTIMVLGAGYMGSGIAQVCATGGYRVLFWDVTQELAEKGKAGIDAGLVKQVARGKLTEERRQEILDNLIPCTEVERASEAELVIEVVVENLEIKKALYARIEPHCSDTTIIGTNTSFIPITKLAEDLKKPERFIGLHFFGPVYAMKLLEIIRGEKTSDETVAYAQAWAPTIGKESVLVNNDAPGFIVNRINFATYAEAYRVMQEGVASIEDIDKALRLGLNHPMGVFDLNDYGGLNTVRDCLAVLYELTGDERFKPVPELDKLVAEGHLGRKTGKGWYDYTK